MLTAHERKKQRFDATCSHLRNSSSNLEVVRAAAVIEYFKVRDSQRHNGQLENKESISVLDDEEGVICAECFQIGTLSVDGRHTNRDFLYHSIEENHTIFVRTQEPHDLFCMQCGDYSYSSLFDLLTKRLRSSSSWSTSFSSMKPEERILNSMGICNMGNTCFMNSVLQLLIHNPSLRKFFKSFRDSQLPCSLTISTSESSSSVDDASSSSSDSGFRQQCIACELSKLYARLEDCYDPSKTEATSSVALPSNLLLAVWIHANHMAGYDQQDAHEFFISLLDGLGSHLEKYHSIVHSTRLAEGSTSKYVFKGIANQLYSGVIESQLTCLSCNEKSCKYEPFVDLSLSIPSIAKTTSTPRIVNRAGIAARYGKGIGKDKIYCNRHLGIEAIPGSDGRCGPVDGPQCSDCFEFIPQEKHYPARETVSLESCLQKYTHAEDLSEKMTCDACKGVSFMQKQLSIAEPPSTLLIHLKRFDFARQSKIDTKVSFPIFGLNLAHYTAESAIGTHEKTPTDIIFPLGLLLTGREATGRSIDHSVVIPLNNGLLARRDHIPGLVLPSIANSIDTGKKRKVIPIDDSASLSLSMQNFTSSISAPFKLTYNLLGLITHSGTLNQGHYIAYIRVPRSQAVVVGRLFDEGLMQDIRLKGANYSDRMNGLARLGRVFDEGMIEKSLAATLGFNEMCTLVDSVVSAVSGVEKNNLEPQLDMSSPSAKFSWIKCDDEYLSLVEEKEVHEADAYMLFYTNKIDSNDEIVVYNE